MDVAERVSRAEVSEGRRNVCAMSPSVDVRPPVTERAALDEPCPRCEGARVRVIVLGLAADDEEVAPLFECRECGFEWGEAIRELMR